MKDTDKDNIEIISEAMANNITPRPLSSDRQQNMLDKIQQRINSTPPNGTETIRADEGGWENVIDLVQMKILRRDERNKNQTVLYRLQAGAVFPCHTHSQEEECLVLEGELIIDNHFLFAGDWHLAKPGFEHPEIKTNSGALILVRSEISG